MRHFFYLQNGNSVGPIGEEDLHDLLRQGAVTEQTPIWTTGQAAWSAIKDVLALPPPIPTAPGAARPLQRIAPTLEAPPTPVTVPGEPVIPSDVAKPPPPPATMATGWHVDPVHPWRRFIARVIDMYSIGVVAYVVATIPVYAFSDDLAATEKLLTNQIVASIGCQILMVPMLALLVATTGTTLGKWAMGIRVDTTAGGRLAFAQALAREGNVFFRGMGLSIPVVTLITNLSAYNHLKAHGSTTWDDDAGAIVRYRDSSFFGAIKALIGIVAASAIMTILLAIADTQA